MRSNTTPGKVGGGKATSESVPSFDAFCEEARLEQRRLHHTVPSAESNTFAYFQWRRAAADAFAAQYGADATPQEAVATSATNAVRQRKRPRGSSPSPSERLGASPTDPLVEATAAQLLFTLAEGQQAEDVDPALKHARAEVFPMPQASTADAEALLAMAELTIRMCLGCPAECQLASMVRKVRGLMKLFIERGVVGRGRGQYPGIAFLMDLLSLRMIVGSWSQLDDAARGYVLQEMEGFSGRIRCAAARAFQKELSSMRATGRDVDTVKIQQLISDLATQVPYDFPRVCHNPLCSALQRPSLPVPPGQFIFTEDASDESLTEDDEVEITGRTTQRAAGKKKTPKHSQTSAPAATSMSLSLPSNVRTDGYRPHPVLSVVTPPRASTAARQAAVVSSSSSPKGGGGPESSGSPCASKYHKRYASGTAHAGHLCQFCVVCHMLEILFNGCLSDCSYKHWPTVGKIRYNLRAHPHVRQLALSRLEKSERGELLKEGLAIPL